MLRGHCVIQGKTHLYPQLLDHSFVGGDLLPQDRNLLVLNCDLFLQPRSLDKLLLEALAESHRGRGRRGSKYRHAWP